MLVLGEARWKARNLEDQYDVIERHVWMAYNSISNIVVVFRIFPKSWQAAWIEVRVQEKHKVEQCILYN
jgi:hypothetical protein